MDFGTGYKKFVSRFQLWSSTIPDVATLTYSDDDYTTYSAPISLNLNVPRKFANRLGSFYSRSFTVTYIGNYPFRAKAMELLILGGTT